MRQIVLDTETTGLEPSLGHRVIEIGCVELINRRETGKTYHQYLCPDRDIDEGAEAVHGLSNEFLADKPRFADIVDDFLEFVDGAELVIHNAPFDIGFLDRELDLLDKGFTAMPQRCQILDTLALARKMHPGQRNSLDALCKRYKVDNSKRELHGALLDARILADVYLAMTGGQGALSLDRHSEPQGIKTVLERRDVDRSNLELVVITADDDEIAAHEQILDRLDESAGGAVWRVKRPVEQ